LSGLLRPSLLFDILLYHLLGAVCAYCADEISIRPELPSPQLLFDFRQLAEDFSGRDALDGLHDLLRAVAWHALYEEMDVVFIRAYFQKLYLVAQGYVFAYFFELLVYQRRKHCSSVLGRTDDVIKQEADIMLLTNEVAHSYSIVPQQAAGN